MSQTRPDYENLPPGNRYNSYGRKTHRKGRNRKFFNHPYNNMQYYNPNYNFQPHRGYWCKKPRSNRFNNKTPEKQPPRPESPFSGTEEYTLKKIQEASDMIKKKLMMPESEDVNVPKISPINDKVENENKESGSKTETEKISVKANKKVSQYNVEEIHNKIITHITNLSHGKKMNLICGNSSGYDVYIQQIQKQKRLELSKVLRDMCSNQTVENSEVINSIIPDIGIKIEDLPLEVIQELSSTLGVNFDDTSLPQNGYTPVVSESGNAISFNEENANPFLYTIKKEVLDIDDAGIISENICNVPLEARDSDDTSFSQNGHRPVVSESGNAMNFNEGNTDPFLHAIKQEVLDMDDAEIESENICNVPLEAPGSDFNLYGDNNSDKHVTFDINVDEDFDTNLNENVGANHHETISIGLQTDCSDLNSVSTQTECILNDHKFEVDINNVNSLHDAMSVMFIIDQEISRLTDLRQSVFMKLEEKENAEALENERQKILKNARNLLNIKRSQNLKTKRKKKRKQNSSVKNGPEMTNGYPVEKKEEYYEKVLNFEPIAEKILVIKVIEDILLAASEKGNIFHISAKTGNTLDVLHVSESPIISICHFKSPKNHILVASSNGRLHEFNLDPQEPIRIVNLGDPIQCMELAWDCVFVGTSTGKLIRYSPKFNRIEFEDKISADRVMVLKATQEGARKVLLVGMRNQPVYVRDAMSGLYLRTMEQLVTPTVYTLVLENSMVYCGTMYHDILVYSFHDGNLVQKHETSRSKGISCMRVIENLLFASSYDGSIYVFNVKTHKAVGTMKGPGGVILSLEVVKNIVIVGTMSLNFVSILIPDDMLRQNKI